MHTVEDWGREGPKGGGGSLVFFTKSPRGSTFLVFSGFLLISFLTTCRGGHSGQKSKIWCKMGFLFFYIFFYFEIISSVFRSKNLKKGQKIFFEG
jgi:hypothetical protein